jgi:O-6-methylguanine DNA methyltransferase
VIIGIIYYQKMLSPVGIIFIGAAESGCRFIHFGNSIEVIRKRLSESLKEGRHPLADLAMRELDEYFSGERRVFTVKLTVKGTLFQREVWRALQEIPYGETVSYKDIAIKIGRPKAIRAVGMANNRNLLPIIIPCHRVVYHSGELGGYAGGLSVKRYLLDLEAANL